jgi:hypothetical protein
MLGMTIGNILQVATIMALASGSGAAVGNLTIASFRVSTHAEPAIVIRLDGATSPKTCREIDTASETRAGILDCGEKAIPRSDTHVQP